MSGPCLLSILIPTYNEAENIVDLLQSISRILSGVPVDYEILVIDDASPDNTAAIAEANMPCPGRVIRRLADERGLSESILDGIKEARGEDIVVMDADGSHPPALIPDFIARLEQGHDLIVASRYIPGGGTKDFPLSRRLISRFACMVGRLVTDIKDNTSGFFCLKKSILEGATLTPRGFKIGLEIFVRANYKNPVETPFIFANRKKGKSKLKSKQIMQYLFQVAALLSYKINRHKPKC